MKFRVINFLICIFSIIFGIVYKTIIIILYLKK